MLKFRVEKSKVNFEVILYSCSQIELVQLLI
jgi:hypothetical protein